MLEVDRQRLILRPVEQQSVISVAQLVETLGASEATVLDDCRRIGQRIRTG